MAIVKEVTIGDCVLYLGNCLEVMPMLGKVDAVVTDPPYGLNFPYLSYEDTQENLGPLISGLSTYMETAKRCIITPGVTNLHRYPVPKWIGAWTWETTNTFGAIGFNQWQPVLFYGEDVPGFGSVNGVLKSDRFHFPGGGLPTPHGAIAKKHVCPKPPDVMLRLIARFSCADETILDPFMGSGTTLVACAKLGRKGIGIELDPDYFQIACERVHKAYQQPDLFIAPPEKPVQEVLI
jgi:DNA modification methylase